MVCEVKRTFDRGNDIVESLRTLTEHYVEKWKPHLRISSNKALREIKQFEFKYQAKLEEAKKRTMQYQENLCKAYAYLGKIARRVCKTKSCQGQISNSRFITILLNYYIQ